MFIAAALRLQGNIIPLIAQTTPQIDTAKEATLAFSGPQFFMALIAGLVLAFGFQMLLTNLSVAAGISALGLSSPNDEDSEDDFGGTVRTIGTAVGIWTLTTVTISLFVACTLAVKLSFLNDVLMGATVGLVIWAAYFSALVWISSTAVGSLVGSVVGAATSGFQAIFGTATAALGAKAAKSEIVSTAEEAAAAIRKELTAYIDPEEVKNSVSSYLGSLKPPELNFKSIREEFEQLLSGSELADVIQSGNLPKVDRSTFEALIADRTDLSRKDAKRITDELEQSWNKAVRKLQNGNPLTEVLDFFKSARPQQLLSNEANAKLDQLLDKAIRQTDAQSPGWTDQALSALTGVIMGRTDLSDLDIEAMLGKVKEVKAHLEKQSVTVAAQLSGAEEDSTVSAIRSDVEDYLRYTYTWKMTPDRVKEDFRNVLYDESANPSLIRQGLEQLNQSMFAEILRSRGIFTQAKINELASLLESERRAVLQAVSTAESTALGERFNRSADSFLRLSPKTRLLSDTFSQDFKRLFEDGNADPQMLSEQLSGLDRNKLYGFLGKRYDLTDVEKDLLVQEAERVLQVAIADTQSLSSGIQARVDTQWQKVQDYLRNTGKQELNPEGIKRDLKTLLEDPQTGMHDLQRRLQHFDRDTLKELLSQQPNLSEADANDILDSVESSWIQVVNAPQTIADTVKTQYDESTTALADYLRNTGKAELNPEGIQRDLTTLLNDPKQGLQAFQDRLARMDRDTLVKLLSQREDLSEAEVNRVIDQVQDTLKSAIKAPQRLAERAQAKVEDFQSSFADYLRNTDKAELDPDGIQRDLTVLFNDPKLGMEKLGDRLSQVDRATVVSLLSQREDISEADANAIVDRVLAVRDQFMAQIEAIQLKIQSAINSVLNRIREYLNALERPELNYEGIQRDVRQLFDDPQAGFEALRDRLGHFDRDTLVAVMSSRDDISQADANRIIDQVEGVRTNVLQRAERIQTQLQIRLEILKKQARAQADATRKAAATAAWWLFATALISGIASALGGSLAVSG